MAIPVKNKSQASQQSDLLEPGSYIARCYSIVHVGTSEKVYKNEMIKFNEVLIYWELPTELKEFKKGSPPAPWSIKREFNLSLAQSSHLRPFLEAWRGKPFTEEEKENFDVTVLVGRTCALTVAHKTKKDGRIFMDVVGIAPVMKGTPIPPQINDTFILDYDNFSFNAFNTLPDWLRKKIEVTDEYKNMIANEHMGIQQTDPAEDEPAF